jgi:hypothetical protein
MKMRPGPPAPFHIVLNPTTLAGLPRQTLSVTDEKAPIPHAPTTVSNNRRPASSVIPSVVEGPPRWRRFALSLDYARDDGGTR